MDEPRPRPAHCLKYFQGIQNSIMTLEDFFERLGVAEPKLWANSQMHEGLPQAEVAMILTKAWEAIVPPDDTTWLDSAMSGPPQDGKPCSDKYDLIRLCVAGKASKRSGSTHTNYAVRGTCWFHFTPSRIQVIARHGPKNFAAIGVCLRSRKMMRQKKKSLDYLSHFYQWIPLAMKCGPVKIAYN